MDPEDELTVDPGDELAVDFGDELTVDPENELTVDPGDELTVDPGSYESGYYILQSIKVIKYIFSNSCSLWLFCEEL